MPNQPTHHTTNNKYDAYLVDSQGRALGINAVNSSGKKTGLSHRRQPYQRSTLRVNSGSGKWSDLQAPFGQFTKSNFYGGMGLKDSETDQTRFYFGSGVWTPSPSGVMLGPAYYHASLPWPVKIENNPIPSDTVTWASISASYLFRIAVQFTVGAADLVVAGIRMPLRSNGNPGEMMVAIYTNHATGGDHPQAAVTGASVTSSVHLISSSERVFTFDAPVTLTAATKYWVYFMAYSEANDGINYVEVLQRTNTAMPCSTSVDGTNWTTGVTPFVFFLDTNTDIKAGGFLIYKWGTYAWMTDSDAADTVHLFLNGDRGCADDNAGDKTKLNDSSKTWVADQFKGAIVRIYSGAGAGEWRKITSNTTNALTVDRAWVTTHLDTTTTYVIIGAYSWIEIAAHGLAKVRDAVAGEAGVVYFAQGTTLPIRRMREYNNAGTWARDWGDDVSSGASFLISTYDQTRELVIWRARNDPYGDVAVAPQTAWGTNLTFETDIALGSNEQDISGLVRMGDKITVVCMDRIWMLLDGVPDLVTSWKSSWDKSTGMHPAQMSSYLVFPRGNNLDRLVGELLEDFGPESLDGLPRRYSGQWVDLWSEIGLLLAAKRAGSLPRRRYEATGESGVYLYRNSGWHNVCLLDYGTSMIALFYQRRDDKNDMLYMMTRDNIYYCFYPRSFDYRQDAAFMGNLHVTADGSFLTGKFTVGAEAIEKWWQSLTLYGVDLHSATTDMEVYYRTSEPIPISIGNYAENICSDWTYLGKAQYDDSADTTNKETKIKMGFSSKQLWLLIRLKGGGDHTPVLQAWTVNYLARIKPAKFFTIPFRVSDVQYDRLGIQEAMEAEVKIALIDEWSEQEEPLTVYSRFIYLDGKTVLVEQPGFQPISFDDTANQAQGRENYFGSLTLLEAVD